MQMSDDIQGFVAMLVREIQELKKRVEFLEAENAELKTKLADYETKKDSSNSSKPPSSDFSSIKKTQSLKKSSGKKVGGQKGHKGNSLKMVSNPDTVIKHEPFYCKCCGNDLGTVTPRFIDRRQVFDIPEIKPMVTEYQLFEKKCTCGHISKGDFEKGVNSPVSYGNNTQALIGYMSARQYVPYKRLEELLQSVFGLSICQGSIKNIIEKMSRKLDPAYETIRQSVINSEVIGADETSVNINGDNHWAWTFQTQLATFIDIHFRRGYMAIEEIVPEGFGKSIIVSDCWASYFKTNAANHQLCTAHILRELQYHDERFKEQKWSSKLAKLIRLALRIRKENRLSTNNIDRIKKIFNKFCDDTIDASAKKLITLQNRLIKYKDYLFLFLENILVPPDNNASERAIRNFKVKQKVSGFFKTQQGAKNYAILRSVCDTAIKNNQNPLFALQTATLV
jgi:transposase